MSFPSIPKYPKVINSDGKCAKQRIIQRIILNHITLDEEQRITHSRSMFNSLLVYKLMLGPLPQKIPVAAGEPVAELHVKKQ
jgi:hypothetical protein